MGLILFLFPSCRCLSLALRMQLADYFLFCFKNCCCNLDALWANDCAHKVAFAAPNPIRFLHHPLRSTVSAEFTRESKMYFSSRRIAAGPINWGSCSNITGQAATQQPHKMHLIASSIWAVLQEFAGAPCRQFHWLPSWACLVGLRLFF